MSPATLTILTVTFTEQKARAKALGVWTAVAAGGGAAGALFGGILTDLLSWRWILFVNVPIGVVALVIGWLKLPDAPGHQVPRPDALGAVLVTAGVGALTFGLVKGGDWGWSTTGTVAVLVASVVALGLFVLHCAKHHNPLIEPALFRVRSFSGASAVALAFSASFGAMLLSNDAAKTFADRCSDGFQRNLAS